jgi:hypothetical protein
MASIEITAPTINIILPNYKGTEIIPGPKSIRLEKISSCTYKLNNEMYEIFKKNGSTYWWYAPRTNVFEVQFPTFPYSSQYKLSNLETKIDLLGEKILKLEQGIAVMVSHMEAFLTIVGERTATENPINI